MIATNWAPLGRTAGSIVRTVEDRLDSLQGYPIALHQVHLPWGSLSGHRAQMRAMARLLRAERIRSIGVSNFTARQMTVAYEALRAGGVTLAANQVQINLVHRSIETNGVLDAARRLGVTLIAYDPWCVQAAAGRRGRGRDGLPAHRHRARQAGRAVHVRHAQPMTASALEICLTRPIDRESFNDSCQRTHSPAGCGRQIHDMTAIWWILIVERNEPTIMTG